jgi:hypothetical protein
MLEDRGSLEDPTSASWLGFLIRHLTLSLSLPIQYSSIPELRASLAALDPQRLHSLITRQCHASCYPPSLTRGPDYLQLDLASASFWPCFRSSAPQFKLCRFFISDSFRHSRLLFQNGIERSCEVCDVPLSIRHWLCCPLRDADRALLATATGTEVNSLVHVRDILRDQRLTIAFEFVLSRFFKWHR